MYQNFDDEFLKSKRSLYILQIIFGIIYSFCDEVLVMYSLVCAKFGQLEISNRLMNVSLAVEFQGTCTYLIGSTIDEWTEFRSH